MLDWFNHWARARIRFWRILGIVPHLGLGHGKSTSEDAEQKSKDHHHVLRELFRELIAICEAGGIRTYFRGKRVILKFWIHFIIGDTKGHNQLCGSFEKSTCDNPMRGCNCLGSQLSKIPFQCEAVTIQNIKDCNGDAKKLAEKYCYRNTDIVFNYLPMGHKTRGAAACTHYETLHVVDQGLFKYIPDVIWNMMKGNKKDREKFNHLFQAMSQYLERS